MHAQAIRAAMGCDCKEYVPFRGLSAWYSASVHPSVERKWSLHGGMLASETEALFVFSDNPFSSDTMRVHDEQKDVCIFLSSWVMEVLQRRCHVADVPLGRFCLQPHYIIQGRALGKGPAVSRWEEGRVGSRGVRSAMAAEELPPHARVWAAPEELRQTTSLEDILHVDTVPILSHPLFDFIPNKPGFVLHRKQ